MEYKYKVLIIKILTDEDGPKEIDQEFFHLKSSAHKRMEELKETIPNIGSLQLYEADGDDYVRIEQWYKGAESS